jgi:exopolyphosphatase/guanosine-5'-triphosphate,3'-diphosphate pyrophosphatase
MLHAHAMDLRAIAHWASRHLDDVEHEQRVSRIASTLFDLTSPLHRLDPRARNLLRAAALVHDVGRSVNKSEHPAEGARILLRDGSLKLHDHDRRALAFLTFYHRDGLPRLGNEKLLKESHDRPTLRAVLALLRGADALDSRSLESPRLVFSLKKKRLQVTCYLEDFSSKARRVYQRRKKFRLMEEELDCAVEVAVRSADALTLVA